MKETLAIASDHAGFEMKEIIKRHLDEKGISWTDFGTNSSDSVDYPEFGHKLGSAISSGEYQFGISLCGSGNGINIVSNKHKGVRAAICWTEKIAEMARRHNDANICSLPARYIDNDTAIRIVDIFLSTGFDGGRHDRRKQKIDL